MNATIDITNASLNRFQTNCANTRKAHRYLSLPSTLAHHMLAKSGFPITNPTRIRFGRAALKAQAIYC